MKLKPCPICGESATIQRTNNDFREEYAVICDECLTSGPPSLLRQVAADAWNTRPAETAMLARVREKIETEMDFAIAVNIDTADYLQGLHDALRAVDEVEKEART